MGKLQVLHGRWMSAFRDWNDVVNDWAEWLRSFDGEVHLLPTNATNVLSLEYHLLILLVSNAMGSLFILPYHVPLLSNSFNRRILSSNKEKEHPRAAALHLSSQYIIIYLMQYVRTHLIRLLFYTLNQLYSINYTGVFVYYVLIAIP